MSKFINLYNKIINERSELYEGNILKFIVRGDYFIKIEKDKYSNKYFWKLFYVDESTNTPGKERATSTNMFNTINDAVNDANWYADNI